MTDAESVIETMEEWLDARENFNSLNKIDRETFADRERLREGRAAFRDALEAFLAKEQSE